LALDPRQYIYLLVYYAALVVPFAVGGTVIASELAAQPEVGHRLYAANLIGSALGGLSLLAILPALGAPGAIVAAALVAALGGLAMAAAARAFRRPLWSAAPSSWRRTPPGWTCACRRTRTSATPFRRPTRASVSRRGTPTLASTSWRAPRSMRRPASASAMAAVCRHSTA